MSATIIDRALKGSVRIVRVIIARYREDSPRSERPLINSGRPAAPNLLEARKASNFLLMECSNAFHSTTVLHFEKVYACN